MGHIIITSRNQAGWKNIPLDLDVFSAQESVEYLLAKTKIERSSQSEQDAAELADALGHLPLALSHAASYINCKRIQFHKSKSYQFSDYLKEFKAQPVSHFEKLKDPLDENVLHGLEINYEYLMAKTVRMAERNISDLAKHLLTYFAYLNPDQICMDACLDYAKKHVPDDAEYYLKQAIRQLSTFSLIKTDTKISMHPLMQLVIRNECKAKKTSTPQLF